MGQHSQRIQETLQKTLSQLDDEVEGLHCQVPKLWEFRVLVLTLYPLNENHLSSDFGQHGCNSGEMQVTNVETKWSSSPLR